MKFFYILNGNKQLIEVGKIDSVRGNLIQLLTYNFNISDLEKCKLYLIKFNMGEIQKIITELLIERDSKLLDIPNYEGRFLENEIFENKKYNGTELKLCNSGFDNLIIFLINIYDSMLKDEKPYYLMFTSNHREFEDWKNNMRNND